MICGCVLVLSGLCLIQYRLVKNTYQLEQAAYFEQVNKRLGKVSQVYADTLNSQVMKALLGHLKQQLENELQPDLAGFQRQINQRLGNYRHQIRAATMHDSLLQHIGYGMQYTRIVLYRNKQIDTLLKTGSKPLLLTGSENGGFPIGGGQQQVGFAIKTKPGNPVKTSIYQLAVWTRSTIVAADWQSIVLRRMATTLLGSGILIIAVIGMFFLIFMALLKQKKIVQVTTDFANNMTHELKTPLSVAGIVVKTLRTAEAQLDEKWLNELLMQLDRQHEKIGRLIDSVLTSALDRPVGIAQLRPFNLQIILDELTMLSAGAQRKLLLNGKTDAIIYTDPDLLTSILSNLMDNALKYSPAQSPLTLNISTNDSTITISLEDKGPGIPVKYQSYLFQKFFRVPQAGNTQIKGLGLGLYLCQIQAQQLLGKLSYERKNPGGSIFNLILPYGKNAGFTS